MCWGRDKGGSGGGGVRKRPCRGNPGRRRPQRPGKTAVAAAARSDSNRSSGRVVVVAGIASKSIDSRDTAVYIHVVVVAIIVKWEYSLEGQVVSQQHIIEQCVRGSDGKIGSEPFSCPPRLLHHQPASITAATVVTITTTTATMRTANQYHQPLQGTRSADVGVTIHI